MYLICTVHKLVTSLYRAHFREAHEAWKQYGPLSDLYVIIIDEIDAICKPRGGCPNEICGWGSI